MCFKSSHFRGARDVCQGKDLLLLLAEEVLLDHTATDGVVKFLVLLKCRKGNWTVNLLQIAVPGGVC